MDWKGKFDRIWCISYTGYPERRKPLERELDRVGILGSGVLEWHYTFKSIFDNILFDVTKRLKTNNCEDVGSLACSLAHYHCIKSSYGLGDERCLIMEDDIRFLKDVGEVCDIVDGLPDNADIVLFDHMWNAVEHHDHDEFVRNPTGIYERVGKHYRRFGMLLGGSCYSLSRKAMKTMVGMYETVFEAADVYTARLTEKSGLVRLCSEPRLAFQVSYPKSNNTRLRWNSDIMDMYRRNGLDFSRYADNDDGFPHHVSVSEPGAQAPCPPDNDDGLPHHDGFIPSFNVVTDRPKTCKIPWRDKFDRIWCVAFTGYRDRIPPLVDELWRVGIIDSGIFEWQFTYPTCFNDMMYDVTKAIGCNEVDSKRVLSSVFGHYNCVKASLELGDRRILVVEDDVRFLKDLDKVADTVSAIRDDSDVILFDYFGVWHGNREESRKFFLDQKNDRVDGHFSRFHTMYSAACYSVNRKAMSNVIRRCESKLYAFDWYLSDLAGETDLVRHFSTEQMACQLPPVNCSSNLDTNYGDGSTKAMTEFVGTDFSLFNITR